MALIELKHDKVLGIITVKRKSMENQLEFTEVSKGLWEAEFVAVANFNLHIERAKRGSLVVSQRGTDSGEYATAFAKGEYEGAAIFDSDFGALVYPKWIKVESGSKVLSCTVTQAEE